MAERVEAVWSSLPRARAMGAERMVARVLSTGAIGSGLFFAASMVLGGVAADGARKAGAALLVATPVVRLLTAGLALGLRGEWRYALYAGIILALLGLALGAGYSA